MTVNEARLDLYNQGFILMEHLNKDQSKIVIIVAKIDTDNLRFEYRLESLKELFTPENDSEYCVLLTNIVKNVSTMITNRHAQNINTCKHNEVLVGQNKCCTYCMGKFGTKMSIDLNNN